LGCFPWFMWFSFSNKSHTLGHDVHCCRWNDLICFIHLPFQLVRLVSGGFWGSSILSPMQSRVGIPILSSVYPPRWVDFTGEARSHPPSGRMGIPSPRRPRGSLEMSDEGERKKRPTTSSVSILVQVTHVHRTQSRICLRIRTRTLQRIGTAWQRINTPAEKWKEQG